MKSHFHLKFLSSVLAPAFIVLSCSTLTEKSLAGKNSQAGVTFESIDSIQQNFLLSYQKAKSLEKSDPAASCALYTTLSSPAKSEKFLLKNLALIRAHLICSDPLPLTPVPAELATHEPWLASLDLDRQVAENLRGGNWRALAQSYFQKSLRSDKTRDKIQLIQQAQEALQKFATSQVGAELSADDQAFKAELQTRLERLAPHFLTNPNKSEWAKVGNDWIFQRQFSQGQDYLKKVFEDSKSFSLDERYYAFKSYRNSFKTEQKKEEYLNQCLRFAQWNVKNKTTPARVLESYLTLARAEWTEGHIAQAKEALSKVETLLKGKTSLEEVYFVRARMAEEVDDLDSALAFLARGEAQGHGHTSVREKILFSQAWLLRKKNQYAKAAEAFLKLKNETSDPFDKNRYTFWLARSLKQSNQTEAAQKELQDLMTGDPIGYYGLMAYRESNVDLPPLLKEPARAPAQESKPKGISQSDQALIQALTFVDEPEILEKFLDQETLDLRRQSVVDPDVWLFVLKSYAKAGLFNPLFQQLGSLPADLKSKLLQDSPELLFPRKFLDLIQTSADRFAVKPELMLSIIRQESAFNPQARSGADALGLMQVIPSAARQHEKDTGLKLESFEDLYKPEVNIPFGASILASLNKKYRNQFLLVAAAYNANDRAISSWLRTRLKDDPLEFIEDVPYEETRAYMKLVLRNFVFYSRLSNPTKPLAFPNWCLDDLQSFKASTN